MTTTRLLIAALLAGTMIAPAAARDLIVGLSTEPSSFDPHFSRTGNNQNAAQHLFNRLVEPDADLQLQPGLAVSWGAVDPLTWEVKLRAGVTFHDGSPFTAADVVYSLERIKTIANSPAPFTSNIAPIAKVEIVDPLTIRFTTKKPTPQFMELAGTVYVVSKKAAEGKSADDFNKGVAAIGTGPYKYAGWTPGDNLTLQRNEGYWGTPPAFDKVVFKPISNDAARIAALRSGAVELIDAVPPNDLAALRKVDGINVYAIESARIIYLALDSVRDQSPFVTDLAGQPAKPNPLKDLRVRKALSKLVNRPLLIDRILSGGGVPAGQFVPKGVGGFSARLVPEAADPAGAKTLLAEAGYPQGFGLTLHSSSDRFAGDAEIAQALGQLFARGGIKVNGVQTLPYNVYVGAAGKQDYSAFVFSFGTTTSSSGPGMANVLMTYDKDAGTGAFNRARYSNPAFDAAMNAALAEFDPARRNALLAEATEIAYGDVAMIPLYWPVNAWATRGAITYVPNKTEDTLAMAAGVKK